jgi:tetraacyldisaccharide 4'-kinase
VKPKSPFRAFAGIRPTSQGALGALFILLSAVYSLAVRLRLLLYRAGILRVEKAQGAKVISIGNLTAGGTGKTPVCILLARMTGDNTAIVSRGYGRTSDEPVQVVSDGKTVLEKFPRAADEALLCARELKTVPVVCAPKRIDGIRAAISVLGARTVILDDAFSHLAVWRDKNILLVDALDPFGGNRLLPAGRLREPRSAAKRATAVIITRAGMVNIKELYLLKSEILRDTNPVMEIFTCDIAPDAVIDPLGASHPAGGFLRGKTAVLVSGIASPAQFEETVISLGAEVSDHHMFADHHPFTAGEIQSIAGGLLRDEILLTTQKDIVRIPEEHLRLFHVLTVRARVREEDKFRDWLSA